MAACPNFAVAFRSTRLLAGGLRGLAGARNHLARRTPRSRRRRSRACLLPRLRPACLGRGRRGHRWPPHRPRPPAPRPAMMTNTSPPASPPVRRALTGNAPYADAEKPTPYRRRRLGGWVRRWTHPRRGATWWGRVAPRRGLPPPSLLPTLHPSGPRHAGHGSPAQYSAPPTMTPPTVGATTCPLTRCSVRVL